MMLYLYVLQNQWIALTLLAGIVLTLLFCLTYQAMWRPRAIEHKAEEVKVRGPGSFLVWLLSFVPWVIILIVMGCITFTVLTVVQMSCTPPNW